MSSIVIFIDEMNVPATSLMSLGKATGLALNDVKRAISNGDPIVQQEIFDAAYDQHATMLRQVLETIEAGSLRNRVYELPEGETMETCTIVNR